MKRFNEYLFLIHASVSLLGKYNRQVTVLAKWLPLSFSLLTRKRLAPQQQSVDSETLNAEENGEIQTSRFGPVPSDEWRWLLTNNECIHGMLQVSLSALLMSLRMMFRI